MQSALRCVCGVVRGSRCIAGRSARVWSRSVQLMTPVLKDMQENPFYDKYKSKLEKVQSPLKEKVAKIREVKGQKKDKGQSPPVHGGYSYTQQPRLDSVMRMDLIADKTSEEITKIWVDYHKTRDCISAVMTAEQYIELSTKARLAPMFVYPLPRDEGYEFFFSEFSGIRCYFTALINYQMYQANAPVCLTLTHYTDLQESKGIVLMLGEVDADSLSTFEAQYLANQVQLYYGVHQADRYALVKQFNHDPQNFDYNLLLDQLQTANISRESDKHTPQN